MRQLSQGFRTISSIFSHNHVLLLTQSHPSFHTITTLFSHNEQKRVCGFSAPITLLCFNNLIIHYCEYFYLNACALQVGRWSPRPVLQHPALLVIDNLTYLLPIYSDGNNRYYGQIVLLCVLQFNNILLYYYARNALHCLRVFKH